MLTPSKSAAILALAVLAAGVDAHGKMTLPAPTCSAGYCSNSPSGTIDGPSTIPVPSGMSYGTDPQSNTNAYLAGFKAQTTYKTLKDLATSAAVKLETGASKECGYSSVTGTAQPLPDTVQWDRFDLSHMGPCEVWCDDVLAFEDDNCSVHMTTAPAVLKYDKSKCVGKKMLTSFWIALHVPTWQIYTNCAPIAGGGGSSSSGGSSSTTPAATTATPAVTTKAPSSGGSTPAATTKAPATTSAPDSGSDEDEDCDDDLDIADTPAPAATSEYADEYATPAPAATSEVGADEDCEDDLDIADTPAPATTTKAPVAATTTKAPKKTKAPKATKAPKKTKAPKTPKPTKTKKTKEAVRTSDLDFDDLN